MQSVQQSISLSRILNREISKIYTSSCMADIIENETKKIEDIFDALQCLDTIKNGLHDCINSHRTVYCLKKETNRLSSRLIGRCWFISEEKVLLTVTNLPQLSYLDLPEYSIDCETFTDETHTLSDIASTYAENELDPLSRRFDIDPTSAVFRGDIKEKYYQDASRRITLDWFYSSLLNLLIDWHLVKFQRFIDMLEKFPAELNEMVLDTMPVHCHALMMNCRDSGYITWYFSFITEQYTVGNVLTRVSHHFLYFFMMHMVNHFQFNSEPKNFMQWIMGLYLVEISLKKGLSKHLHYLVAFGWPSIYTVDWWRRRPTRSSEWESALWRQIIEELSLEEETSKEWHRTVANVEGSPSYWSPKYMAIFVVFLFSHTYDSEAPKENLADCIRLMWRTVPTPLVTADDIAQLIKKLLQHDLFMINPSVYFSWRNGWANFLDLYPKELLIPYQPRSLLHLSRCELRKQLEFTVNAEKFPIPREMKNYLNLEW